MRIAIPKEYHPGELRVPMIPADVGSLAAHGASVEIEAGMGETAGYCDSDYREAGAGVNPDRRGPHNSGGCNPAGPETSPGRGGMDAGEICSYQFP